MDGTRYVKLANLGRGITEGGWRRGMFKKMRRLIAHDGSFLRHYNGTQEAPPQYYFDQIKSMLGTWSHWLPAELSSPSGFVESERSAAARPVLSSRTPVAGLVTLARPQSDACGFGAELVPRIGD